MKLTAAALIFAMAMAGGLFPILIRHRYTTRGLLFYGEAFANGIFIGVAVFHMLPEAYLKLAPLALSRTLLFLISIFGATLLLLWRLERRVARSFSSGIAEKQQWLPFLLAIMLSVHSYLAGAALGLEFLPGHFFVLFMAIMAHKGIAAFALGINMRGQGLKMRTMLGLMILFSLMTPLGIISSTIMFSFLTGTSAAWIEPIFNAIAAGTFVYIALFNHLKLTRLPVSMPSSSRWRPFYFLIGLFSMAIFAFWV